MYSSRLVFLIVFFFCSVHTYKSKNEQSEPAYESADEGFSEEFHHTEDRSAAVGDEESEALPEEEVYEPKPNKKSKKYGKAEDVVRESGHQQKKSKKVVEKKVVEEVVPEAEGETAEDSVYNKEMKNVSNKKSKKHNKKYESGKRHEIGGKDKPTYEDLNPELNEKTKTSTKKENKRVRRSENKREQREAMDQMSESAPQEKEGRHGRRSESDPSAEVSQESKPVKQNQKTENNRKSKSGKNVKQSKKKNGSHKKDKRSFAYFGLWA